MFMGTRPVIVRGALVKQHCTREQQEHRRPELGHRGGGGGGLFIQSRHHKCYVTTVCIGIPCPVAAAAATL
jgi:hypothetical protein